MRRDDFERLYEEHAQPLFGFLAYRTGDPALAEDLLADTFERALRAQKALRPAQGEREDLAVHDRAQPPARQRPPAARPRRGRSSGSRTSAPARPDEPDRRWSTATRSSARCAILSDEEREAIALRFGGDLTVPEIAKLLKQPLPRIEGRVYRSLRKLRDELD